MNIKMISPMFCVVVFSMRSMGNVESLVPCVDLATAKQAQTNAVLENIHGFLDNVSLSATQTESVKNSVAEIIRLSNNKDHDKVLHEWRVLCNEYDYDIAIQIECADGPVDEVEPSDAKLEHYFLVESESDLNPGINRAVRQEQILH